MAEEKKVDIEDLRRNLLQGRQDKEFHGEDQVEDLDDLLETLHPDRYEDFDPEQASIEELQQRIQDEAAIFDAADQVEMDPGAYILLQRQARAQNVAEEMGRQVREAENVDFREMFQQEDLEEIDRQVEQLEEYQQAIRRGVDRYEPQPGWRPDPELMREGVVEEPPMVRVQRDHTDEELEEIKEMFRNRIRNRELMEERELKEDVQESREDRGRRLLQEAIGKINEGFQQDIDKSRREIVFDSLNFDELPEHIKEIVDSKNPLPEPPKPIPETMPVRPPRGRHAVHERKVAEAVQRNADAEQKWSEEHRQWQRDERERKRRYNLQKTVAMDRLTKDTAYKDLRTELAREALERESLLNKIGDKIREEDQYFDFDDQISAEDIVALMEKYKIKPLDLFDVDDKHDRNKLMKLGKDVGMKLERRGEEEKRDVEHQREQEKLERRPIFEEEIKIIDEFNDVVEGAAEMGLIPRLNIDFKDLSRERQIDILEKIGDAFRTIYHRLPPTQQKQVTNFETSLRVVKELVGMDDEDEEKQGERMSQKDIENFIRNRKKLTPDIVESIAGLKFYSEQIQRARQGRNIRPGDRNQIRKVLKSLGPGQYERELREALRLAKIGGTAGPLMNDLNEDLKRLQKLKGFMLAGDQQRFNTEKELEDELIKRSEQDQKLVTSRQQRVEVFQDDEGEEELHELITETDQAQDALVDIDKRRREAEMSLEDAEAKKQELNEKYEDLPVDDPDDEDIEGQLEEVDEEIVRIENKIEKARNARRQILNQFILSNKEIDKLAKRLAIDPADVEGRNKVERAQTLRKLAIRGPKKIVKERVRTEPTRVEVRRRQRERAELKEKAEKELKKVPKRIEELTKKKVRPKTRSEVIIPDSSNIAQLKRLPGEFFELRDDGTIGRQVPKDKIVVGKKYVYFK